MELVSMVGRNRHNVELLRVAYFLLRGAKLTNHVRVFHYAEVKLTNQIRLTHYVKRIYSFLEFARRASRSCKISSVTKVMIQKVVNEK